MTPYEPPKSFSAASDTPADENWIEGRMSRHIAFAMLLGNLILIAVGVLFFSVPIDWSSSTMEWGVRLVWGTIILTFAVTGYLMASVVGSLFGLMAVVKSHAGRPRTHAMVALTSNAFLLALPFFTVFVP